MLGFQNSVIELYVITYDGDPDQTYSFVDYDKAVASIESSLRGYIGEDCDQTDVMAEKLIDTVRRYKDNPVIPIRLNNLFIIMHRVELDHSHRIHKTLTRCYKQVDRETQSEVESLFKSIE